MNFGQIPIQLLQFRTERLPRPLHKRYFSIVNSVQVVSEVAILPPDNPLRTSSHSRDYAISHLELQNEHRGGRTVQRLSQSPSADNHCWFGGMVSW